MNYRKQQTNDINNCVRLSVAERERGILTTPRPCYENADRGGEIMQAATSNAVKINCLWYSAALVTKYYNFKWLFLCRKSQIEYEFIQFRKVCSVSVGLWVIETMWHARWRPNCHNSKTTKKTHTHTTITQMGKKARKKHTQIFMCSLCISSEKINRKHTIEAFKFSVY